VGQAPSSSRLKLQEICHHREVVSSSGIEHGAWSKARQEVGRDEDSKAEVETRNVEFFSVLIANGLSWLTG